MGAAAGAGVTFLAKVLAAKEAADFLQIGLVSWQTAKRFSGSRGIPGGSMGIDGGVVRVSVGDVQLTLPIEDAAMIAGVPGAAGGARRPSVSEEVTAAQLRVLPGAGLVGRWLESRGVMRNPTSGDAQQTVSVAPDPDARPFTLREFSTMQNLAIRGGQERKIQAELELEALRQEFQERLAAARTDLDRERLRQQFAEQERELQTRILLQRERLSQEDRAQQRLFAQQVNLLEREQRYKTVEAERDRQWRERTAKEGAEIADYRKNLSADLALTRSLEAARKIKDIVGDIAKAGTIGGFAGRFAP